jgi:hypothetical protein
MSLLVGFRFVGGIPLGFVFAACFVSFTRVVLVEVHFLLFLNHQIRSDFLFMGFVEDRFLLRPFLQDRFVSTSLEKNHTRKNSRFD